MELKLDLEIDLGGMDETGMPWAPVTEARDQTLLVPGNWIIVGEDDLRAVAQVIDCSNGIVHVQVLRGPIEQHLPLLNRNTRLTA